MPINGYNNHEISVEHYIPWKSPFHNKPLAISSSSASPYTETTVWVRLHDRSELDALENDMKSLRDAVRAKEELWDQAIAREQSYREHLARLSVELITMRQLSDSRLDELQRVEEKLTVCCIYMRTLRSSHFGLLCASVCVLYARLNPYYCYWDVGACIDWTTEMRERFYFLLRGFLKKQGRTRIVWRRLFVIESDKYARKQEGGHQNDNVYAPWKKLSFVCV